MSNIINLNNKWSANKTNSIKPSSSKTSQDKQFNHVKQVITNSFTKFGIKVTNVDITKKGSEFGVAVDLVLFPDLERFDTTLDPSIKKDLYSEDDSACGFSFDTPSDLVHTPDKEIESTMLVTLLQNLINADENTTMTDHAIISEIDDELQESLEQPEEDDGYAIKTYVEDAKVKSEAAHDLIFKIASYLFKRDHGEYKHTNHKPNLLESIMANAFSNWIRIDWFTSMYTGDDTCVERFALDKNYVRKFLKYMEDTQRSSLNPKLLNWHKLSIKNAQAYILAGLQLDPNQD